MSEEQQKKKTGFRPVVLFLFGIWILWGFGFQTVWKMLQTEISGVVVSSRNIHHWYEGNSRYSTRYQIRGEDGQEREYMAGPTDGTMQRNMPVGTKLKKRRWQLDYERDGERIHFPIVFYDITLGIGLAALLWSFQLWRSRR
jgi:hypothetical protein